MKYCINCGKPMDDNDVFCTVCGTNSNDGPFQPNTPQAPQNNNQMPPDSDRFSTVYAQEPQENNGYPPDNGQYYPNGGQYQQIGGQYQQGGAPYYQNGGGQLPPPNAPYYQNYPVQNDSGGKKSNTAMIIALIASILMVLAVCGLLIFVLLRENDNDDKNSDSDSAIVETTDDEEEEENDSDENKHEELNGSVEEKTEPEPLDNSFDGLVKRTAYREGMNVKYVSSDVSDYPTVKLYFTVEDKSGNTLQLTSPNVAIKETIANGKELEREVKSFEQLKGREGVSFDIVADKSGSMSGDMPKMQTIMSEFVEVLDYNSGDRAELIAFDSFVMYMCTYSNDVRLLNNGINNMTANGETAFYDALYEALINAGSQRGARCIIAFTDGVDNSSIHTSQEVINKANSYSVPIFIIGTKSGNHSVYNQITSATGGAYWNIDSINDMSEVLDQIYSDQKDMYCLEYISEAGEDAYAERSISCVIEDETYGAQLNTSFTPTETLKETTHASRYELIVGDVTWSEANAECIRRGGHLITITSDEEMKMASEMAAENGLKYVWMGGYTSVSGRTAYGHWITGEDFSYQKWYPGEPSRNDKDGAEEMYLMLWFVDNEWSWNDQRNDVFNIPNITYFNGKTGYICEYEE